ncbi:MAG: hypothetical protein H0Z29_06745 [Candidatus Marinimicrobia bacterium]|nr:hypothetical protein [Candidatus Neomarinimicrobiota bacterium]
MFAAEKTVQGQCDDPELEAAVRKSITFDGSPILVIIQIHDPTIRSNVILTVSDSSYYLLYRKAFSGNITIKTTREHREIPKSDNDFRVIDDGIFKINPDNFSDEDIENIFRYLVFKRKTLVLSQEAGRKVTGKTSCYIATLAYGNILNKNVEEFRLFRDVFLARSKVGRIFIPKYYRYSPILIDKVKYNACIKSTIKAILDCALHFIRFLNKKKQLQLKRRFNKENAKRKHVHIP